MKLKSLLSALLLFSCFMPGSAQNKAEDKASLNERIRLLELERKNFDKQLEIQQKNYEADLKKFQAEIRQEHEKLKGEIGDETSHIKLIAWTVGGVTIFGLISIIYSVVIQIRKTVREEIEKNDSLKTEIKNIFISEVKDMMSENKKEVEQMIGKLGETLLLLEKKILVICKNEQDRKYMYAFFSGLDFKHYEVRVIKDYEPADLYDLVIFDNRNCPALSNPDALEKLQPEDRAHVDLIQKYLTESPKISVYVGNFAFFIEKHREKVNSANTKFTIYPRIMETLAYQQMTHEQGIR